MRLKSIAATAFFLSAISLFAQAQVPPRGPRGPQLTDAQKSCLEGILGKPGENGRPSPEEMQAAFKTCKISAPDFSQPPSRRAPEADQETTSGPAK